MKKIWTRGVSLALALMLCASLCASASAKQEAAQYHSKPLSFGQIDNLEESWTSLYVGENSAAWGTAWLRDEDGSVRLAGSLGVEARMFNHDGELIASTGMRYNTTPASFVAASTAVSDKGYCSWGDTRSIVYYAESYSALRDERVTADGSLAFSYETGWYKWPENLQSAIDEHPDGYPTNRLGETYGSALFLGGNGMTGYGFSPALLSAVGTGGVHGYVRKSDLSPAVSSRTEALKYMSELEENRVLPLYDKDGTVIGTFVLDGSFTSGTTEKELNTAKAAAAKPTVSGKKVSVPTKKAELDKLAKRSEENCPYERTAKGETYGTSSQFGSVGYPPVWITVKATDTHEDGLVLARDFYANKSVMPVYDLDGNEVGDFHMGRM